MIVRSKLMPDRNTNRRYHVLINIKIVTVSKIKLNAARENKITTRNIIIIHTEMNFPSHVFPNINCFNYFKTRFD